MVDAFIRSYKTDLPALEIKADINYNRHVNGAP